MVVVRVYVRQRGTSEHEYQVTTCICQPSNDTMVPKDKHRWAQGTD